MNLGYTPLCGSEGKGTKEEGEKDTPCINRRRVSESRKRWKMLAAGQTSPDK